MQRRGVKVHLEQHDGCFRVVFDDVLADETEPSLWREERFYTETQFDAKRFSKFDFSEKELADIGLTVLARLGGDHLKEE
jgi:hypothetical protein